MCLIFTNKYIRKLDAITQQLSWVSSQTASSLFCVKHRLVNTLLFSSFKNDTGHGIEHNEVDSDMIDESCIGSVVVLLCCL